MGVHKQLNLTGERLLAKTTTKLQETIIVKYIINKITRIIFPFGVLQGTVEHEEKVRTHELQNYFTQF